MSPGDISAAVARVRAEFMEMPGLRLTPPQAARLMGLDQATCDAVIEALVRNGSSAGPPRARRPRGGHDLVRAFNIDAGLHRLGPIAGLDTEGTSVLYTPRCATFL